MCFFWVHNKSRREAARTLGELCTAIDSRNPTSLLKLVLLPTAIQNQTADEKTQFLMKALQDEISPQGLSALVRQGSFGALLKIFPREAVDWAGSAGVEPSSCVGFKMQSHGISAEVVLVIQGDSYRVLRCNNVKQMAGEN